MSGYVSFVTEFGVLMASLLAVLVVANVTIRHAWSRGMLCWLVLVAYLYVQFEAYAFYALALVVWCVGRMGGRSCGLLRVLSQLHQLCGNLDSLR